MKMTLLVASLALALANVALGQSLKTKTAGTSADSAGVFFMFADGKDTFIFKLTAPKRIQEARDILDGKEKRKVHVSGVVVKEPAAYNAPWHYRLNPDTVSFFENSAEVYDSSARYVEDHLAEVGGDFLPGNRWCPWSSRLVQEVTPAGQNNALLDEPPARSSRLTGGFIQLGNAEKKLPPAKWADLLGEMKDKLGMDTILIQALFSEDSEKHHYIVLSRGTINPDNPRYSADMVLSREDPTDAILNYADGHGMNVYVGLWMQDLPFGTVVGSSEDLDKYLNDAARKSTATAELAWNLYHRHPSFRGWYIAYELWNFPFRSDAGRGKKQEMLRQFLSSVAAKCDELNGRKEADGKGVDRPVAVSAFFNPWFDQSMAGPPVTTDTFKSVLTGSGIDMLILQDSVGAKCLGGEVLDDDKPAEREEIKRRIMPEYLRAFYEAAKAAGTPSHPVQLWDDVEAYETVSGRCPTPKQFDQPEASLPFKPSNITRLKWQFDVATLDPMTGQPYVDFETDQPIQLFDRFVVFDSFHYMNTVIPQGYGTDAANTQQLRTALFNDYKREFVDGSGPTLFQGPKTPARKHRRRARSRK
jgi:hypothetical protein